MHASKQALHCVSSQTRPWMRPPPTSMHLLYAGAQMSLRHLSFSRRVGSVGIAALIRWVGWGGGEAPHRSCCPGFILRQQVTVLSVWLHSPSTSAASAPMHPEANDMRMKAILHP